MGVRRREFVLGRTPALGFPQHPDEHRPDDPVLLSVDQQLGEGAALRVGPELTDPFGAFEVGEHEDVKDSARAALGMASRLCCSRRSSSSGRIGDPMGKDAVLQPLKVLVIAGPFLKLPDASDGGSPKLP